jgi:hypothetical protein
MVIRALDKRPRAITPTVKARSAPMFFPVSRVIGTVVKPTRPVHCRMLQFAEIILTSLPLYRRIAVDRE